jgi:hypothetical protein
LSSSPSGSAPRSSGKLTRDAQARLRGAAAGRVSRSPPVISAAAWFAFFKVIYGTFKPVSALWARRRVTFLSYVPGGFVALFLDQQFGLLTIRADRSALPDSDSSVADAGPRIAPARAGLSPRSRIAYLAASASYWMWWAGVPAPPRRGSRRRRWPLLAVAAAIAWARTGTMTRALALAHPGRQRRHYRDAAIAIRSRRAGLGRVAGRRPAGLDGWDLSSIFRAAGRVFSGD